MAHAAHIPLDDVDRSEALGWIGWGSYENEEGDEQSPPNIDFTECSVLFPEHGGGVAYHFPEDARPTGLDEVSAALMSFSASVPVGNTVIGVLIDRVLPSEGIADLYLQIPAGVHGFSPDSVVALDDFPSLGLSEHPTVQEVLDALDAEGNEFYIIELALVTEGEAELQWVTVGSETHWFGSDPEWFTNDPTCGTDVPEPTPETPEEPLAPKPPVAIETGR